MEEQGLGVTSPELAKEEQGKGLENKEFFLMQKEMKGKREMDVLLHPLNVVNILKGQEDEHQQQGCFVCNPFQEIFDNSYQRTSN